MSAVSVAPRAESLALIEHARKGVSANSPSLITQSSMNDSRRRGRAPARLEVSKKLAEPTQHPYYQEVVNES